MENFEKLKGIISSDLEQLGLELVNANDTQSMLRAQGAARALASIKDKIELVENGKYDEILGEDR